MFRPDLLHGQRILVTGGGTGLGAAMAARFAGLGASLVLAGRRPEPLAETAAGVRALTGATVETHPCDIRDAAEVDALLERVWRDGPLDALVNNAAATFIARSHAMSTRAIDAILATTLHGTLHCTHGVGRRWIAGGRGGTVTLRVRLAREMARIEIEDPGPGLTAEEIEHIFEPFARGGGGGGTPGAGLGLTIAKMLTALMGGELTVRSTPGQGSVFQVRLFLPEVAGPARVPVSAPAAVRKGYEGSRCRILVVDNEEADRDLLVQLLEPIGFELRQARSGHDALDLVATGYRPDAVFMDLAMPGIDGWETLQRLRVAGLTATACAIVSANAFDKGLDNTVGIGPDDFFVKPVRHRELLDWLGRRLDLVWTAEVAPRPGAGTAPLPDAPTAPAAAAPAGPWPEAASLAALEQAVTLGYYRGILNALDQIEREQPACAAFVTQMREHALAFRFEAMHQILSTARHAQPAA